jgi:hypothetical protein
MSLSATGPKMITSHYTACITTRRGDRLISSRRLVCKTWHHPHHSALIPGVLLETNISADDTLSLGGDVDVPFKQRRTLPLCRWFLLLDRPIKDIPIRFIKHLLISLPLFLPCPDAPTKTYLIELPHLIHAHLW